MPLLVGMDAPNGTAWAKAVTDYPGVAYTRDFGTPTKPTAMGAGKWGPLPAAAIMHVSWKGDVTLLGPWLSTLTRPVYLTWYHEPMGDVTPSVYRATAAQITSIVDAHPNKHLVLGHGPIVTRYWLDENKGNPLDWAYPGMTHYGVDCYMNAPSAASYYDTTKMFTTVFDKVRAACPGVRLWVPEYGLARINSDTTGEGRAAAMRSHIEFLRTQDDVDAVAYFNNAVQFPQFAIAADSPEGQAWRDVQAWTPPPPPPPVVVENYPLRARQIVLDYVQATVAGASLTLDDVFLVWFSKTLQNWKALVATTLPDAMYYEVTYNGSKAEAYLDVYSKVDNVRVPDEV